MAWKSSFRKNYRTTFSPAVPTTAAGISHVVEDVEAPGGAKWEHLKSRGKQWQATPKNLPRMQRTRAITSRLTELWSLPRPAQGLNTNNNNNNNNNNDDDDDDDDDDDTKVSRLFAKTTEDAICVAYVLPYLCKQPYSMPVETICLPEDEQGTARNMLRIIM